MLSPYYNNEFFYYSNLQSALKMYPDMVEIEDGNVEEKPCIRVMLTISAR
jgi:hypothetical protein